jgi:hypothetical protein
MKSEAESNDYSDVCSGEARYNVSEPEFSPSVSSIRQKLP